MWALETDTGNFSSDQGGGVSPAGLFHLKLVKRNYSCGSWEELS